MPTITKDDLAPISEPNEAEEKATNFIPNKELGWDAAEMEAVFKESDENKELSWSGGEKAALT
jgi:hypothetical protein